MSNAVSWVRLKRLVGIAPATPNADQEGQFRYVRSQTDTDGKLYVARMVNSALAWYDLLAALAGKVPRVTTTPTVTPIAAGAGSTGTATLVEGNDRTGMVSVTPGGTGIASGSQLRISFGAARAAATFSVQIIRTDVGAGTFDVRPTGRTTAKVDLWSATALTSGTTYQFFYTIEDE